MIPTASAKVAVATLYGKPDPVDADLLSLAIGSPRKTSHRDRSAEPPSLSLDSRDQVLPGSLDPEPSTFTCDHELVC